MKSPKDCKNIDEIRNEIDRIDDLIITALAERFEFVKEASKFKQNVDAVLATDRHDNMFKRRTELCRKLNFDEEIVQKVYSILLDFYKQKQVEIWINDHKE